MSLLGFPVDGSAPSDAHNFNPDSPGADITRGTGTGEDLGHIEDPAASTMETTGDSDSSGMSKTAKYGAAAVALAGIAYTQSKQ